MHAFIALEVKSLNPTIKIYVYAICKNESQFIDRWIHSMSEADGIVVLDTGSTDDSFEKLKKTSAYIKQEIISPWRFDTARNKALEMVPEDVDVCVSTDLDEVFLPGWCEYLKKNWSLQATAAKCRHIWSFNPDGSEGGVFWPIRIHKRHDYTWSHPIHEILSYIGSGPEQVITLPSIQLNHYPDPHKSRAQYLTMLEEACKVNPSDERDRFYLGREYMYHGHWLQGIQTFKTYLSLPHATWKEERCAAMRFIAKCYINLHDTSKAIFYLEQAIKESPYLREPYVDLAYLYYSTNNWQSCAKYCDLALQIPRPSENYINEPHAWNETPYDIGAIAHFRLGHYDRSLAFAAIASSLSPNDKRLSNNIRLIEPYVLHEISHQLTTYPI